MKTETSKNTDVHQSEDADRDCLAECQLKPRPLIHQVAGHRAVGGKPQFALVHGRPGTVLKPLQDHARGVKEERFYKNVFSTASCPPIILHLRHFLPQYHGTISLNGGGVTYLELSDLTAGYREPCIVDIKVGALLYGPEKMASDLARLQKKYPLASQFGYQILGMKTYCPRSCQYVFHDKLYFRQNLNKDNVISNGISLFLHCHPTRRRQIVRSILIRLHEIRDWFLTQRSLLFYGTSLLFVYEGYHTTETSECTTETSECTTRNTETTETDCTQCLCHVTKHDGVSSSSQSICKNSAGTHRHSDSGNETETESEVGTSVGKERECRDDNKTETESEASSRGGKECECRDESETESETESIKTNVHMIDFTHVFPTDKQDDNYLFGLNKLISHFETIL